MKRLVAYKANVLVEAQYKLSLQEQRVLLVCISKIQVNDSNPDKKVVITAEEFYQYFPDMGRANAEILLREAVKKLWDGEIVLKGETHDRYFRWIQERAIYHNGLGKVEIIFSERIMPYLFQLKEQFTKIALRHVSRLSRSYSIRLYELLQQFATTGNRLITIIEFRRMIGVVDKYLEFRRLQEKIIAPVVQELNEKTNLDISIIQIRKNRKVVALHFFFNEKPAFSSITTAL